MIALGRGAWSAVGLAPRFPLVKEPNPSYHRGRGRLGGFGVVLLNDHVGRVFGDIERFGL